MKAQQSLAICAVVAALAIQSSLARAQSEQPSQAESDAIILSLPLYNPAATIDKREDQPLLSRPQRDYSFGDYVTGGSIKPVYELNFRIDFNGWLMGKKPLEK